MSKGEQQYEGYDDEWDALTIMREQEFLRIVMDGSAGTVAGVEFDLRHPELPRDIWQADMGAFQTLVFPWSTRMERELAVHIGGALILQEGDRVRIDRVDARPLGSDLVHPADREVRYAWLAIDRVGGEVINHPTPSVFYHALSTAFPGYWGRPTQQKVMARLLDETGLESLAAHERVAIDQEDSRSPALRALDAANRVKEWRSHVRIVNRDDPHEEVVLDCLIDSAVALGYFAAMSDRERYMAGPAESYRQELIRLEDARKPAREAVKARGKAVLDAAIAYVQLHPRTSQADCARAVSVATGRTVEHVTEVIKHMFEASGHPGGGKRVRLEYLRQSNHQG